MMHTHTQTLEHAMTYSTISDNLTHMTLTPSTIDMLDDTVDMQTLTT